MIMHINKRLTLLLPLIFLALFSLGFSIYQGEISDDDDPLFLLCPESISCYFSRPDYAGKVVSAEATAKHFNLVLDLFSDRSPPSFIS